MKTILNQLTGYKTLTRQEARTVLYNISSGSYNPSQVAAFLTVFMMRSVTVEELAGFREALQELCISLDFSEFNTIDLCGTGGDGKDTFNISTLASLVVAGAGEKVVKHGNYALSSACGSSNVMEYFGYKFTTDADKLKVQLDKAGMCYLHAPLFHPAMKAVGPIRRELGVKTFFNVLGPLINPASPQNQFAGVYSLEVMRWYNYLLQQTDKNFMVVHSLDGYDEVSLTGNVKFVSNRCEAVYSPRELGFVRVNAEELSGGNSVADAASIFMSVLKNEGTNAQKNAVLANAGLALHTIRPERTIPQCMADAQVALETGKALEVLRLLVEKS